LDSNAGAALGVAVAYVRVSDSLRDVQRDGNRVAAAGGSPKNSSSGPVPDYEMSLEVTCEICLAPWWSLQPDFQYIFHPGGATAQRDAVVLALRTRLLF